MWRSVGTDKFIFLFMFLAALRVMNTFLASVHQAKMRLPPLTKSSLSLSTSRGRKEVAERRKGSEVVAPGGYPESSSKKFTVGENVEGNWQMEGGWYSAVVTAVSPGNITIQYDDDATFETLPVSRVRSKKFAVGERVQGNWHMEGEYYEGVVTAISPGGSITIQYDEDGSSEALPIGSVRKYSLYG
jgi:hypothetical protein